MSELGLRLLFGELPDASAQEGEQWLRQSAERGDRLSMVFVAHLLDTDKLHSLFSGDNSDSWRALAGFDQSSSALAAYLCRQAFKAPTANIRRRLLKIAAAASCRSHMRKDRSGTELLAFLVRRGEPCPAGVPISELMRAALENGSDFAIVNRALQLAAGFECICDWHAADAYMRKLERSSSVREWWTMLSDSGDIEGDLVIGWLVRHGLTLDPADMEPYQRFSLARASWNVPEWME